METVAFSVPVLETGGNAADRTLAEDLATAVSSLSGVEHVEIDLASHTVSVRYDPTFTSTSAIRRAIEGSGYPIADHGVTQ
jgi:copper chaperone CopZ